MMIGRSLIGILGALSALFSGLAFSGSVMLAAPPLQAFNTITADATGSTLRASMIWAVPAPDHAGVTIVFRRSFDLASPPAKSTLSIFADARFVLWINGEYVDRGPSRFQPNGPQYDIVDLSHHLREGRNTIAVLVVGRLSGGKVMLHDPGFAAILEADGREILRTDSSWRWTDKTRYQKVVASWANLGERLVDATLESGDWTQPEFDDQAWAAATKIDGAAWGPLTQTLIPPRRETPVSLTFKDQSVLPVTLRAGERLEFSTGRIVQAYPLIEFDADAGTKILIEPFGFNYVARAGRQKHFTIDTCGLSKGAIVVKSGRATITTFRLIERLYPFDRLGSFKCSDDSLNRLWQMCARSCEVLSEDSYVDCADRERVEWMDNTPPGFEMTRVAMAGRGRDGKIVYSDPRLLAALIRRTALTLQPEGWVKAHTCSDRYDIHAKMEDRCCNWIEGQRLHYEATGDKTILGETWPAIVAQMDYFLSRRTDRGLVRGRDWVVWGNPVGYIVGEGTTLNVFVQRALVDATMLGKAIGKDADSARFAAAAVELGNEINTVLWDEATGTYHAGYYTEDDIAESLRAKRKLAMPLTDHLAPSTLHSNLFALDRGVVPPDRRARVVKAMLDQHRVYSSDQLMVHHYALKQMYELDEHTLDVEALNLLRTKWATMASDPWQCSWETFTSGKHGSKAHIYGMYPGYFLSSYVLGVRRDAPVGSKTIVIEPHPGDLSSAAGVVVTEFGTVPISWERGNTNFSLQCEVPADVSAELLLPVDAKIRSIWIDGVRTELPLGSHRSSIRLGSGKHEVRTVE